MGRSTMPIENRGSGKLCLFIEPQCEDYWMEPGEEFTVRPAADGADVWFGTSVAKGCVTVWLYEDGDPNKVVLDCAVVDASGTRLASGHQRPPGQRWSAADPIID
ncbi:MULTISPECIES: hypothetical protein [unclassified Streptomyces]|uniref:hypothetical protein n=1 Tax=unclassified Streptomyces TaxID=2593676 RepID=UPI000DBA3C90|nr:MULTISPECIES: hypothetical protein [unclassified Streptomyces]MYT68161.1 hypothetical protein [Streptomyces sp. SID8367]RAJ72728.1 hypothetical protein K377_07282 [Streptomyces sp. PsTaAH-137]